MKVKSAVRSTVLIFFFFILIERRVRPTVKQRVPFNGDTQALSQWL